MSLELEKDNRIPKLTISMGGIKTINPHGWFITAELRVYAVDVIGYVVKL